MEATVESRKRFEEVVEESLGKAAWVTESWKRCLSIWEEENQVRRDQK